MGSNLLQDRGMGRWQIALYQPTGTVIEADGVLTVTKEFHTVTCVRKDNREVVVFSGSTGNIAYCKNLLNPEHVQFTEED